MHYHVMNKRLKRWCQVENTVNRSPRDVFGRQPRMKNAISDLGQHFRLASKKTGKVLQENCKAALWRVLVFWLCGRLARNTRTCSLRLWSAASHAEAKS